MRFLSVLLIVIILCAAMPAAVYARDSGGRTLPKIETESFEAEQAAITRKEVAFDYGDVFSLLRYSFPKTVEWKRQVFSFDVPGNVTFIDYFDETDGESRWIHLTEVPETLPKTTIFLSTDSGNYAIGVPAVYKKQKSYGTLEIEQELELPITIASGNRRTTVSYSFPFAEKYIGEIWMLSSEHSLVSWNEYSHKQLMVHELSGTRRLSMDGYYFETPADYAPSGENILFLHPACYTGGSFSREKQTAYESDMGYVLMKLHAQNQSESGHYPTPCKSGWLYNDFGIGSHFYDTRWNSDFATNLLDAYASYGDPEFLERAVKYAEFYMDFAENYSYQTGKGILVSDYWQEETFKKTHASLNHHVAELNFLLKLYGVTKDERYKELAERMLQGIEETRDLWVMDDGNLKYALYYEGSGTLTDYPALTYNDLYIARALIEKHLGKTSSAIQWLMDSKLGWMRENGVEGYYG